LQAVLDSDRRKFLQGLFEKSPTLTKALQKLALRVQQGRMSAADTQRDIDEIRNQEENAIHQGEQALAQARALTQQAAAKITLLKKSNPELLELLNQATPGPRPVELSTDILVHGVARKEAAPLNSFLQAMADSATDCMVLEALHSRLGVNVRCSS
jgi:small-conductance mechanosensitive channel